MKCRLCGKTCFEIGGYLERVNEFGVPGVFECRPSCDAKLTPDERVIAAVLGTTAVPLDKNSPPG